MGDDLAGEKILSELHEIQNLNCNFVRKENSSITGFTISLIRNDGERLFLSSLGHQKLFSLNHGKEDLLELIKDGDLVHVSGFFMLPRIRHELQSFVSKVKKKGADTSFDPGWDPEGFGKDTKSIIRSNLPKFDYFEPDLVEMTALASVRSPEGAAKKISQDYPGIIALKEGKNGSRAFQNGKVVARAKAIPSRVSDTTGAGDSFDAGFLSGILEGYDLPLCLKLGNTAASITISEKSRSLPDFRKLFDYAMYQSTQN